MSKPGYESIIKRAKINADCGEHLPPAEVTELLLAFEAQVKQLAAERDAVVAESAGIQNRMQQLIDIINKADNDWCMCGEAMEIHGHGGCGHPVGMFDYHYGRWSESETETPATDAYASSLRAEGVEMFAEQQRSHIGMPNKNDAASSYSSREAIKFAAQLRSQSAPSPRVAATPETAAIARMFEQVKGEDK